MNEVFKKTRELGEAIMNSDEYKTMKEIEAHAMGNAEAAQTMGTFLEKRQQIEDLLQQEDPDPALLKSLSGEMDEMQERLQMLEDVQALTEARNNFSALIDQVNDVLRFIITGNIGESESSENCGGSCSSCSGCGHTLH